MGCCFGSGGDQKDNKNENGAEQHGSGGDHSPSGSVEDELTVKVVCVGDTDVGKSAFFKRVAEKTFKEDDAVEVEQRIITYTLQNGKKVEVELADTCGQEKFRTVTTTYYRSANGAVVAFNLANKDSFKNVRNWLEDIKKYKGESLVCKILVGMKSDLARQVEFEEAETYAEEEGTSYYEVSNKTGDGVTKCFDDMIMEILKINAKKHLT